MVKDDIVLARSLGDVFGISPDDADILEDLRRDIVIKDVAVGETLMTQGEPSDALYVLLQGRLCASTATAEGEVFLGEIRRGETIGETGVIMEAPRGATVRATRTSTVARLSAKALHGLLGKYPTLSIAIARTLISRAARDAGPRHPGFVPETLCLLRASQAVDLAETAELLAREAGGPVRIVSKTDDPQAARREIHEGERAGQRVFILADLDDAAWLALAVSEADEVVRIVDAGDGPEAAPGETAIERAEGAVLPRHTLLILHPDATKSPTGTKAWLAGRQVDRHLHMRRGNAQDRGRVGRLLSGRGVGIVFAGGGARGAAHLGAIRALQEAGVDFDIVGGTSIGAAVAAWYAMGLRGTALDAAACKVFVESGGPTSDWNLLPILSLVKGKRTRDLAIAAIREATGRDIDIEDTWTPYFCLSANYTAQDQAVLQRAPLWKALTAT
ncbi:cyclic nucleotide-binding and patatin-like phospholipase domain-containing protein [Ovoidimarina sediminis]|uniref:cyclic nucleotide-binding and patatin-like phospholipase domain-containing protein n=1 Tax=Ovoidimarina sediminis TaxID=3079856 RepID=UPI0029123BC2|nr:cyclic nucleotide-binding and patatin-like phospholipase domain-containing protein [Rhodophyticola sp. MJ-SS7]MDU8943878.1 cyclic nucleotide-binding and patatin-like phospholipase domain-containing protein [Rhodophyticola sp. MJ-SS7]